MKRSKADSTNTEASPDSLEAEDELLLRRLEKWRRDVVQSREEAQIRRGRGPSRDLKEVLKKFIKTSGLSALSKFPELSSAWAAVVPEELSSRTRLLSFQRGVLQVGVEDSVLAQELSFYKEALLGSLRAALPKQAVRDIKFKCVAPEATES